MAFSHDVHEQIVKIDHQMIVLLEQRARLCQRGEAWTKEEEEDMIGIWLEEAGDRDLDDGLLEKIGRSVWALCKKARDE